MTRHVAPYLLLGLAILVTLVGLDVSSVQAAPPAPVAYTLDQPDNTSFDVRNAGDEWDNWVETLDGYSVIHNESTGYWEYAQVSAWDVIAPGLGRVRREVLLLYSPLTPTWYNRGVWVSLREHSLYSMVFSRGLTHDVYISPVFCRMGYIGSLSELRPGASAGRGSRASR